MIGKLVIRADADARIGTGHIMRCLALAQGWQDGGGDVTFVTALKATAIDARLQSEGMSTVNITAEPGSLDDATQTAALARELQAAWVVADGYQFAADYQQVVKETGLSLALIDDYGHASRYVADIVLNQNAYAHEGLYAQREPYTQLLLGARYTLLRREFTRWRTWKREISSVPGRVLVTLGGADPANTTLEVVRALEQARVKGLEVAVVVGASYPHCAELTSALDSSPLSVRLLRNATDMPELMAWADIAIAGGGATAWELAFMGLPSLILVLADNQLPVAEWLDRQHVAIRLNRREDLSQEIVQALQQLLVPDVRVQMSQRGREIIDGRGCQRVLERLRGVELTLRRADWADCKLLWKWANDTEAREASFSSEAIPWEQHVEWFKQRIDDPDCIIYIASNSHGAPIGQVRYETEDTQAVISISLDSPFRNQGYGSLLIKKSSEDVFSATKVQIIHAYVKSNNEASARAFAKAGFQPMGTKTIKGCQALHLTLSNQKKDASSW